MSKKKFGIGTVEVNDRDRYVYKFVKCCYSKNYTYDYLTKVLKVYNSYSYMGQIYAIIRLIIPEGAIIVTPKDQSFNGFMCKKCVKHRTDKLIFDKVINYFYIDDRFKRKPEDRYVRLYSKDINNILKIYNINKNQIKYYSAFNSAFNNSHDEINYMPNIIMKPFEKLDCDISTECASGLHFFFNMKDLNRYIFLLMCR
jgi:hypothetical protein